MDPEIGTEKKRNKIKIFQLRRMVRKGLAERVVSSFLRPKPKL